MAETVPAQTRAQSPPLSTEGGLASSTSYANSQLLGQFASSLHFEDLPPAVVQQAKAVILDTVGCIVGGVPVQPSQALLNVMRSLAGRTEASVLGTNLKTDCVSAAFVNAYLSDILDFEDTLVSHPSAGAIPAALAVGERVSASGRDIIRAVVAAYEIGVRVQRAIMPTFARRQMVSVEYAWKAYPAVVAAGSLLGLTMVGWIDAFGYAGRCSPLPGGGGLLDRPLPWIKANYSGQTSVGVLAALLAAEGFEASREMLDSEFGYSYIVGSDRWDADQLTRDLGTSWLILETNLKPYPCCRLIHPVLDAIELLKSRHAIQAEEVQEVRVRSMGALVRDFADYRPKGLIDAEFSVPYAVAMSLLGIDAGPAWYSPDRLRDGHVLDLAARVYMQSDEESDEIYKNERRYTATVEITLQDGRKVSEYRPRPRGGPLEPLTLTEIENKFMKLATVVLDRHAALRAHDLLTHLEDLADIRVLTNALSVQ